MANNYVVPAFYGIKKVEQFGHALQQVLDSLHPEGIFVGDNLITFGKSLSFLEDKAFMNALKAHVTRPNEQQLAWRQNVLCWAARQGAKVQGDFVECACYRGTSARIVCDYTNFAATGKRYYLYDLFEHSDSMEHHSMPEHGQGLYEEVVARFADVPNVVVTRGRVPEVLHQVSPEVISFLHLDLNNATAEVGALELLFDRMVPGAILILDDYGWGAYHEQRHAEDKYLEQRGYRVLELPTGQGMVIK